MIIYVFGLILFLSFLWHSDMIKGKPRSFIFIGICASIAWPVCMAYVLGKGIGEASKSVHNKNDVLREALMNDGLDMH